jgi:hypothetical protein
MTITMRYILSRTPLVSCFGTEDRKEGEGKVDRVTETYGFIYFQESQIKDLSVIDAMQPPEFPAGVRVNCPDFSPWTWLTEVEAGASV